MKNPDQKLWDCLGEIWDIRAEILSYATLFKAFQDIEAPQQHFYGVGIALTRISRKLEKINHQIDRVAIQL